MKKLKIWMTVGLQASGKTTWANQKVSEGQGGIVNINKDDLRAMLHNSQHSSGRESLIIKMQESMISAALEEGKHVIISDTNLNPIHIERIQNMFGKIAEIIIEDSFLSVPLNECISRDKLRKNPVGEKAIRETYNRWLKDKNVPLELEHFDNKKDCYIFDVDGTLTMGPHNRSPFDWSKVGQDKVNKATARIFQILKDSNFTILVVSGRDSSCRKETENWFTENDLFYDELFMREQGDTRSDDIIKEEILNNNILPEYNILGWFDDRLRVCRMLYKRGVPLFRVGDPESDF